MPIKVIKNDRGTIYDVSISKTINGKRYQRRCWKSKSLPEAKNREFRLLQEIHEDASQAAKVTLDTWAERWLSRAQLSRKVGTVESYKRTLYSNIPVSLWNKGLTEITSNDIYDIVHNPDSKIKPKTRENLLHYIRVMLRDAVQERILTQNPADLIKVKVPEPKLEAWTLTEVNRFLSEAFRQEHPWYPIWVVTVYAGLRSGEAYALTWDNIDLENRRLFVVQSWTSKDGYHETKNRRNRVVPINDELYRFLIQLKLQRGNEKYVLPHFNSWTKGEQAKVLRDFAAAVGLRSINFHALRASFITICLLQGVPVVKVQAMVGHESLETTMRYVRLIGADLEGATDNLGIKLPNTQSGDVVKFNFGYRTNG